MRTVRKGEYFLELAFLAGADDELLVSVNVRGCPGFEEIVNRVPDNFALCISAGQRRRPGPVRHDVSTLPILCEEPVRRGIDRQLQENRVIGKLPFTLSKPSAEQAPPEPHEQSDEDADADRRRKYDDGANYLCMERLP